ncbi:chloride channel protein [Devosia marina]|uniref:chloride channel protein n=1 Tax=Devosia marina TaxID=2683198 RepID=UPI003CCD0943
MTAQTALSNGFGASVGLEASYMQMGSSLASRLGDALRLRRGDLRKPVGCRVAGAIATVLVNSLFGHGHPSSAIRCPRVLAWPRLRSDLILQRLSSPTTNEPAW